MIPDDHRVQVDVKNLPDGAKPRLKLLALERGLTFTDLIRSLLIEAVYGEREREESGYTPIR